MIETHASASSISIKNRYTTVLLPVILLLVDYGAILAAEWYIAPCRLWGHFGGRVVLLYAAQLVRAGYAVPAVVAEHTCYYSCRVFILYAGS